MGVLNATDDSFSGDGLGGDARRLAARGLEMALAGADILDIGAASSRPGAPPVSEDRELARASAALTALTPRVAVPLSIDSTRAGVVEGALRDGARVVNDVSGLADARLAALAAAHGAYLVIVHSAPRARSRADRDARPGAVVEEVERELGAAVERAVAAGLPRDRVLIDPGLGFAKTPAESFALLGTLGRLGEIAPVVVGASRKGHLGAATGRSVPERAFASAAAAALAVAGGAQVVRAHDVAATVDAVRVADAVRRGLAPSPPRLALIGLGANQEDPLGALRRAVTRLAAMGSLRAVSALWRSAPMYRTDQPPFLNAVAAVEVGFPSAASLVARLKEIERELGRVPAERYAARTIDLDLLLVAGSGSEERDGDVVVPHERLAERRFALGPLAELVPTEHDPRSGRTVSELLSRVADQPAEPIDEGRWWTIASR